MTRRTCPTTEVATEPGTRRRRPPRSTSGSPRCWRPRPAAPTSSWPACPTPAAASDCAWSLRKGPQYGSGTLYSPSTRQDGLVQSADLTVTALSAAGVPIPESLGGFALRRGEEGSNSEGAARDRLRHLLDFDQASHEVHPLVPPFFNAVVVRPDRDLPVGARWSGGATSARSTCGCGCCASPAGWPSSRRPSRQRRSWPTSSRGGASPSLRCRPSSASGCSWRSSPAIALLGPWGRRITGPMVVVALATLLVLGGDVMIGSHLQISSLMGLQPVVGGRFYGMGNVTFALFATAALLLCIAVSEPLRPARATREPPPSRALVIGLARRRRRRLPRLGCRRRWPAGPAAGAGLPRARDPGHPDDLEARAPSSRRGRLRCFLLVGFLDSLRAAPRSSPTWAVLPVDLRRRRAATSSCASSSRTSTSSSATTRSRCSSRSRWSSSS